MLEEVMRIAEEAGAAIMRFYGQSIEVSRKADESPLTLADQASHEVICGALHAAWPDIPVVSEESESSHAIEEMESSRFWLVDPLDGTKEFIRQTGQFTVNIALIARDRPVLGVVYAPAAGLFYAAEAGKGAWRARPETGMESIQTRAAGRDELCVVASRDHAGPQVKQMLDRMPGAQLTSMGSSLKFCLVAEGSADVYLRDVPTMEWDTAAAQCVVEAAGGGIYLLDGEPLRYRKQSLKNSSIITVGDRQFKWHDYV